MANQIEIVAANDDVREDVVALLQADKLPVEDLPSALNNFFIAIDGDTIVGAIGMEQYGDCALLRSLVVNKDYRNKNIAAKLVDTLEQTASTLGIGNIYLLTETVPAYFEKKGYTTTGREQVPQALQASSEFSHVCPVSAIVMKKSL